MRNSERYKYSKGNSAFRGSSSKPQGKSPVWLETKFGASINGDRILKSGTGVIGTIHSKMRGVVA